MQAKRNNQMHAIVIRISAIAWVNKSNLNTAVHGMKYRLHLLCPIYLRFDLCINSRIVCMLVMLMICILGSFNNRKKKKLCWEEK